MPSPFPGMDPYLEDAALWRGVHHRLITYIADTLNASLPRRYAANIDERLYVVESDRDIYPDTLVKQSPETRPTVGGSNGGGKALDPVAEGTDPALVVELEAEEAREAFIEIVLTGGIGRVVAVIEVPSPSNKTTGSEGRQQYRAKQREILGSPVHLLEIDLLRDGAYIVAAPEEKLRRRAAWDYVVCLHIGGCPAFEAWPIRLQQRLPRVRVPLVEPDIDLTLDVQAMIDRCYDAGNYARQIDYRNDPRSRLDPGNATWVDSLLRQRGLRD